MAYPPMALIVLIRISGLLNSTLDLAIDCQGLN